MKNFQKNSLAIFLLSFVILSSNCFAVLATSSDPLYLPLEKAVNNQLSYLPLTTFPVLQASYAANISAGVNQEIQVAADFVKNTCYGQWQKDKTTGKWFFVVTDVYKNPLGFLANGWYNLEWKGVSYTYHLEADGFMTEGWYREGNDQYYLIEDHSDPYYGRMATEMTNIGGVYYNFDVTGKLIGQITGIIK